MLMLESRGNFRLAAPLPAIVGSKSYCRGSSGVHKLENYASAKDSLSQSRLRTAMICRVPWTIKAGLI